MKKNFALFLEKNWYDKKYDGRRKEFRGIGRNEFETAKEKAFFRRYIRAPYQAKSLLRRCYESVCDCARPENGNYQKIVMYGSTWIYLCSPIYGHKDYNKYRLMPIDGNKRECEFLMRVSERVSKCQKTLL